MRKYTHIICLALALLLTACHSNDEMAFSVDPKDNIEALWQIIDTKYCYVEDKGINWAAIHDEYIAKAELLEKGNQVSLFDLCAGMLDSLRDGHVNLYSTFDVSRNTAWYDTYPANYDSKLQALYLHDYRVAGSLYYCTVDNDSIGYIYYNSFSNSFGVGNLAWVFSAFKECKGLDHLPVGRITHDNAYLLAAPFFKENQTIGYWQHKTGTGHHDFSAMEPMTLDASLSPLKWDKPVIVLCNRRSYSATNLFVSLMRYAEQSTIVGGISGGGGGMPMSYELPIGWLVRFSSVRMYDRDKNDIEEGIAPDVLVNMQSTDKDDIIEKAIELINKDTLQVKITE